MPTFRALTGKETMDLTDLTDEVQARVEAAFPEVFETKEDGRTYAHPNHPKRARAAQQLYQEGELAPAVWLAWEGEGKPKAPADLLNIPFATLLDYAREVRAANPFLTSLPEPEPEGNADAPVG